MTTELDKLFPAGQTLTIKETELTITPFKLGELPNVFKVIDPITKLVLDAIGTTGNQMESLSKIMVLGGDNVLDLLAVGSRQPRAWIDQLELDEGVQLLTAILEVNASFFVQKVLPLLTKAVKTVPAGQV
jgi:hypothetical protein